MRPVLSKADFVRRYQEGEFGNRAPTWDTLAEFTKSNYRGLVHIRNRIAGGPTWYDIPDSELELKARELFSKGLDPKSVYYSGMAPTSKTTLQGEVERSVRYINLTYSTVALPMRDALAKETRFTDGLAAVELLRRAMDGPSYDWLNYLLFVYEDHVVEFSCYSIDWGTIPNRNTVFWEVRKY